jgi:hypothetical protein
MLRGTILWLCSKDIILLKIGVVDDVAGDICLARFVGWLRQQTARRS